MDPIVATLANIVGTGIIAAILLVLHWNAIKEFRKDQREQREQTFQIWANVLETLGKDHRDMMVQLCNMSNNVVGVRTILEERKK